MTTLKKEIEENENRASEGIKSEQTKTGKSEKAREFLRTIQEFPYEKYDGVGLGSNIRSTKKGLVVGGLSYRNKVIHLSCVEKPMV